MAENNSDSASHSRPNTKADQRIYKANRNTLWRADQGHRQPTLGTHTLAVSKIMHLPFSSCILASYQLLIKKKKKNSKRDFKSKAFEVVSRKLCQTKVQKK